MVEKIESDPVKLAARGFPPQIVGTPQRICTNAFPNAESLWPHFVCDYAPLLALRLAQDSYNAPHGVVRRVEIGPLAATPRFVTPPVAPDLAAFLDRIYVKTGPKLRAGEDRVAFWSGETLDLRSLTIIGATSDERSLS
ncbi:hypothetical protein EON77_02860 [bacterium]|nr:MAG: hypothetical protein EON77_02860 [bacterium]